MSELIPKRTAEIGETFAPPEVDFRPPRPKRAHKIGMIGCGSISRTHLAAYRKAGFQVVALLDLIKELAEQRAVEFYPKAVVCQTLEEFLARTEVEVVDITTHPAERLDLIEACLRAGKHVLSQKPFVLDLVNGARLVQLAAEKNLHLAVNQNGRWAPHFCYLRRAAQTGALGRIGALTTAVSWDHTWTKATPFERIKHLLLYDFGIHWFDFVSQVFLGQRALKVAAFLEHASDQLVAPALMGSVAVRFERGIASLAFHGHCTKAQIDLTVITGNEGILFSRGPNLEKQKIFFETPDHSVPVKLRGRWSVEGFQGTMGELLCAIEEGRAPSNSAENNLDSLALCFAAIQAAETGEPQVPGRIEKAPRGCFPE